VVYEDMMTGAMEFNYGDLKSNLGAGENLIDIQLSNLGSSSEELRFAGRYLTGANTGPSGVVTMLLHPPNGKPAMEVSKEDPIQDGWFDLFHPGGSVEISYVLKAQSKVLFSKLNSSSSIFSSSGLGPHRMKVNIPS